MRLFEDSVTFHGPKYTYSIPYTQIQRLFLLDKADKSSVYFVVRLGVTVGFRTAS